MITKLFVKPVFNKTVLRAIEKAAKRILEDIEITQVMIILDSEGKNAYHICRNYRPVEKVGYMDLIESDQDLEGNMNSVLHQFNTKFDMQPNSSCVQFINHNGKLRMCLFDKHKYVKDISFDEIFSMLDF